MKNIKLTIAYDGTDFFGWQATSTGPSVEETLLSFLTLILQENILLQAASRTDRGVHAEGQIVNFFTQKELLNCEKLLKSLNSLLPKSIQVCKAEEMALSFHPTLDAVGKQYAYEVFFGEVQPPQNRLYAWHIPDELDIDKMRQAAEMLSGSHDFSAFCNSRKDLHGVDKRREVQSIKIVETAPKLTIFVTGNCFLYKMVRVLVGTLVYVGKGKIPISEIPSILTSKTRALAGITAPAHGLVLKKIFYPKECESVV